MLIPTELDTVEPIPFAGGTGLEIWAMACAARDGDVDTLRSVIGANLDLVHCGHYGCAALRKDCYRPLHFAVHANQLEAVQFLLGHGAHVLDEFHLNSINQSLKIAREAGFDEVYQALDDDRRARFGYHERAAVVASAIRERDVRRVSEIIAKEPGLIGATDETGNAAIHWAVLTRQMPLIPDLVQLGADIDHTRFDGSRPVDLVDGDYWFNHSGYAPADRCASADVIWDLVGWGALYGLCVAIRLGDMEQVERILAKWPEKLDELSNDPGARATAGEHGRQRPIVVAAKYGRIEMAKKLIEAGADVNLGVPLWSPDGGHALFEACARGDVALVGLLLDAGARPNAEVESSGDCFSIMDHRKVDQAGVIRALLLDHGGVPLFDESEA